MPDPLAAKPQTAPMDPEAAAREVTDAYSKIRHDIGKVIGKDGRTAQSIRTLLNAAASKAGRRAHLDILD